MKTILHLAISARLLTAILMAQSTVEITSIVSKTNGVSITWMNTASDQSYRLEYRNSLGSEAWQPVRNYYGWPTAEMRWTEPSTSARSPRFYRVVANPIEQTRRGTLTRGTFLGEATAAAAQSAWRPVASGLQAVGSSNSFTAQKTIKIYRLLYQTVQPSGLPVEASGTLFLPVGETNDLPLASYQHGSTTQRSAVPSQNWKNLYDSEALVAVILANAGYATVMPDYIGLGSSSGAQPYFHAATEASTVIDLLRATRTFCATNGVTLNSQLFLLGFSQGGHATLAAQREIERAATNEFTLTAAATIGAPIDMSGVYLDYLLSVPRTDVAYLVPMIVFAYTRIYDLAETFEELLAPSYRSSMSGLFDGTHSDPEVFGIVPPKPYAFLRADVLNAFRTDPIHPLRNALRDNNVYDWTPRAPIHLYHSHGDNSVSFDNAQKAYDTFSARGACCTVLSDPSGPVLLDHVPSQYPAALAARDWFDTMKEQRGLWRAPH